MKSKFCITAKVICNNKKYCILLKETKNYYITKSGIMFSKKTLFSTKKTKKLYRLIEKTIKKEFENDR